MFMPARVEHGVKPWQQLPCSAIATKVGMAMYMTGGKLALASGATKPEYICMEQHDTAVAANTPINVLPVTPGIVFETQCSAALTSIAPGNKVTIATDGLRVTATTSDGVAKVLSFEGTAIGSNVLVCFD